MKQCVSLPYIYATGGKFTESKTSHTISPPLLLLLLLLQTPSSPSLQLQMMASQSQHPEEDFVSAVQHLVGRRVQVRLFDGTKYTGLFYSASSKNGIVLKDPLLVEETSISVLAEGWNKILPEYLLINPNNISHLGEEAAAANGNSASNYDFLPDDIYLTRAEILNDMSSWNLNPDAPSFVPRREYQILPGLATAHTVASWFLNETSSSNLNPDAPSYFPSEYQILPGLATAHTVVASWPLNETSSSNLNPDAPRLFSKKGVSNCARARHCTYCCLLAIE